MSTWLKRFGCTRLSFCHQKKRAVRLAAHTSRPSLLPLHQRPAPHSRLLRRRYLPTEFLRIEQQYARLPIALGYRAGRKFLLERPGVAPTPACLRVSLNNYSATHSALRLSHEV